MPSRRRTRSRSSIRSTLLLVAALGGLGLLGLYAVGRMGLPPVVEGRIPTVAYEAYLTASEAAPTVAPGCSVDWTVLAGISQVEARHGRVDEDHDLAANGDVLPEIRGAALDGRDGTEPVADTDGGELDGDATWDRAMGPLQFIPTTWAQLGRDGNGDGVADPDNLYDASLTAVAHLCLRDPGDYGDRVTLREALVGYNASGRYAEDVLAWIERYRTEPLSEIVESPEPEQRS
ncbi:MAG: lytic transglycosylase domain-containing protein [Chloroflexi bacterium]|nr:lytic transglycosylase domain-containing protein [Chloroflexota bacterium]